MKYLAILLLLPLAACATLSEDQCLAGDWYSIGLRDGADGRLPDYLQNHAKACAEYGVVPDKALWEKGRQDGLLRYCQPESAWREGSEGHHLSPVCPPEGLAVLERANWRGRMWYRIDNKIDAAEQDIRSINSALASLPQDDPSRAALIAERSSLRLKIFRLRAEQRRYRL